MFLAQFTLYIIPYPSQNSPKIITAAYKMTVNMLHGWLQSGYIFSSISASISFLIGEERLTVSPEETFSKLISPQ